MPSGAAVATKNALPDIGWLRPDGAEMTDADWEVGYAKSLGVYLNGHAIPDPDRHGRPIIDDSFYLVFNSWDQELDFRLPGRRWGGPWEIQLDTLQRRPVAPAVPAIKAGQTIPVSGHHFILLRQRRTT